jgi:hypothetical protein
MDIDLNTRMATENRWRARKIQAAIGGRLSPGGYLSD